MPTIVTTNYSGDELERRMTPDGGDAKNAKKTLDRLKEMCVGIEMAWDSWRVRRWKAVIKYPGSKWGIAEWIISHFSEAPQLSGTFFWKRGRIF